MNEFIVITILFAGIGLGFFLSFLFMKAAGFVLSFKENGYVDQAIHTTAKEYSEMLDAMLEKLKLEKQLGNKWIDEEEEK